MKKRLFQQQGKFKKLEHSFKSYRVIKVYRVQKSEKRSFKNIFKNVARFLKNRFEVVSKTLSSMSVLDFEVVGLCKPAVRIKA